MNHYFNTPTKGSLRQRLAKGVLVLGLLAAAKLTFDASPREQAVQLYLPLHLRANLEGVRLTYLEDDVPITGTEQRFVDGAPEIVRTVPSLSPGSYQLDIELMQRAGAVTRLRRSVTVPTEGTLRIRVDEQP